MIATSFRSRRALVLVASATAALAAFSARPPCARPSGLATVPEPPAEEPAIEARPFAGLDEVVIRGQVTTEPGTQRAFELWFAGAPYETTTDDDGRFELRVPRAAIGDAPLGRREFVGDHTTVVLDLSRE